MQTFAPHFDAIARDALLSRLADEIAELAVQIDAATARLLDLIREFDEREGWGNGFRDCAHWLTWRVGFGRRTAREKVRVARALGDLPLIRAALGRGEISYSKVRELTRVATSETEERLLKVARTGTAVHVERIVRAWRRVDRQAEERESARWRKHRSLRVYQDDDGMVVLSGRLEPEAGALLMRALDAARETLYQRSRAEAHAQDPAQEPPAFEQQAADALALVAETALHHELDPGSPGERYQVVVHVEAPVLADVAQRGHSVLDDGMHLPAATSQRLACDASRVVMTHDERGHAQEVGARTRTIPPALRRALQHRDHGCRFPACGVRITQGHHLVHWANGGPTTLSNLALLCRRHHRTVHEDGYQVTRLPNGDLEFRRPDGRVIPDVPASATAPPDAVGALRATHAIAGLQIDARTAMPGWLGEPLDVVYAIDVLHPLAIRPSVRA
jgi:hypothetical protein